MRFRTLSLLALVALFGCGGSDSDDSAAPAPDVTRLILEDGGCTASTNKCDLLFAASYSTGANVAPAGYVLVTSFALGDPPSTCSANSTTIGTTYGRIPGLTPGAFYSFRGCLFNNAGGTYSTGAIGSYVPPAP